MTPLLTSPALLSIVVLVVGAVVMLLFTTRLTRNTTLLTIIGMATLAIALIPALRADGQTTTAVIGIVIAGAVGMLLVGSAELQETTQRPEIATLMLLGAAGGIAFATAADLVSAALGLETLSLTARSWSRSAGASARWSRRSSTSCSRQSPSRR